MEEKKTKQISVKLTETVFKKIDRMAKSGFRSNSQQVEKLILEHPEFADLRKKILEDK